MGLFGGLVRGAAGVAAGATAVTGNMLYGALQNVRTNREVRQVVKQAADANFEARAVAVLPGLDKRGLALVSSDPQDNDVYDYDTRSATPGLDYLSGGDRTPEGFLVTGGASEDRVRALMVFVDKAQAEAAGRDFDGIRFDLIACIPITKKQHKKRGYNQSWLLAAELGTLLGLPASQHLLLKPADIKPQHSLNAKERQANVLDAFCVQSDADVAGKTILLCDDIKTTGATLNEGAKTLLAAGAAEVYAVCAAAVRQTGYRA